MIGAIASHYAPVSTGYIAECLADNPFGLWVQDDPSGTQMTDYSGNARHGTYVNSPGLGAAPLLAAASSSVDYTPASSHYASIPDDAALDSLSAITVEAIFHQDATTGLQGICSREGITARQWQFRCQNGELEFVKISGGVVTAQSAANVITAGNTFHGAAVWNNTDIRMYVEGALSGTPPAAVGAMGNSALDVLVASIRSSGGGTPGSFFNGRLQCVAIYLTALSAARIAAHHAAR